MRENKLRRIWKSGGAAVNGWLAVPNSFSAETMAHQGWDSLTVDLQHGVNDYLAAASMIQAIELVGGTPIARVPWNEPGIIGKVLDAGAHGVVVPMVNTREQAEAVVRSVRYAPDGSRSWGPVMAGMRHDENKSWAEAHVATIPMIETAEAIDNLDEILSVPGVDAIYVGPADLGVSLGLSPYGNDGNPTFDDALKTIVDACRRHGVVPGIRNRRAHAGAPRAGLPHDHRDVRRHGDPRRLHQRTRRSTRRDSRRDGFEAVLTTMV